MVEHEEDELQMALRMSLQTVAEEATPPDAKRTKPGVSPPKDSPVEESPEMRNRRIQRELMAAAAEKRMKAAATSQQPSEKLEPVGAASASTTASASVNVDSVAPPAERKSVADSSAIEICASVKKASSAEDKLSMEEGKKVDLDSEEQLSMEKAEQLFSMLFGAGVSRDILSQWSNQGIRFSSDLETSLGLVQHEGGPCGVLAALQAFALKYLLFLPDGLGITPQSLVRRGVFRGSYAAQDNFTSISEDRKTRALVLSMVEILFSCGNKRAVVATLNFRHCHSEDRSEDPRKAEMINPTSESLPIKSASDLQNVLRVKTYTSQNAVFEKLMAELRLLQSGMGALLFLISALLSRGLDTIQEDRDDPSLPLVTAPFGHASQEIVNLLLCGEAVANVFDGRMDLGGGMFLKGIPKNVEVGFLTLLESLNFCKVGQHLKRPSWPIWVVGSESHYTVLFALDTRVQDENELEERESKIRKAFDTKDQSGGGGFISADGFHQVLRETNINFPPEKIESLSFSGFVVWSEFWQALLELDKNFGGLKDSSDLMGNKQFDLYHFNGIAKSVLNGNAPAEGESLVQRPRLCKLKVSVPPKWSQDEFLSTALPASTSESCSNESNKGLNQASETLQHAPLADCIRTRWPRAICSWVGDAPSIV